MKRKLLAVCILIVLLKGGYAQQDPQYSQYLFNSLVINPAYAGYRGTLNLDAIYRNQWQGVEGAPQTQSLIIDGSFVENKVGLALGIVNDKAGLRGKFLAYLNYAYKIKMGKERQLAFGLAGGLAQYNYDGERATYEEMQMIDFVDGRYTYIRPDARFGIHYSTNKIFIGLSATNLMSNALSKDNQKAIALNENPHFFLSAGYLFKINDFVKMKPSFLLKEDTKGPTSAELSVNFLLADKIWLGSSYRSNVKLFNKSNVINTGSMGSGIVGILRFNTANWNIGYAYDYSTSSLRSFNASHEINVGVVLNKKKNLTILSPRYF
jgi:type IX secretion system PorP/SprF family membrane protein